MSSKTIDDPRDSFRDIQPVKPVKSKSNSAGLKKALKPQKINHPSLVDLAKAAVQKRPEAMVKVTGGGKGVKQIRAHVDYIARNGDVEIENQDGEKINGLDELKDYKSELGVIGLPYEGNKREALNVVLSMPAGTNEKAVLAAARNFAAQEFDGHKYVMALHEEVDERGRKKHPHVHICVLTKDRDGHRLNPRKADLYRWRLEFARKMREQGVDAVATRSIQRLKHRKPEKFAVAQIKAASRGEGRDGRNPPKKKPDMPRVIVSQAKEVQAALEKGVRPVNPYHDELVKAKKDIEKSLERAADSLAESGHPELAKQWRAEIKRAAADTETKSQRTYDQAIELMRRNKAKKDIER